MAVTIHCGTAAFHKLDSCVSGQNAALNQQAPRDVIAIFVKDCRSMTKVSPIKAWTKPVLAPLGTIADVAGKETPGPQSTNQKS